MRKDYKMKLFIEKRSFSTLSLIKQIPVLPKPVLSVSTFHSFSHLTWSSQRSVFWMRSRQMHSSSSSSSEEKTLEASFSSLLDIPSNHTETLLSPNHTVQSISSIADLQVLNLCSDYTIPGLFQKMMGGFYLYADAPW